MSRRNVRENVFKLVYEASVSGGINELSVEEALRSEKETQPEADDEVLELIKSRFSGDFKSSEEVVFNCIDKSDREYFDKVFYGIEENREKLENIIKKYARAYEFDRLYKVDKAILLVAIYEILYMDDIPYQVSVNEAVELAKIYSTEKSAGYINGVLASVIKNMEELK